MLDSIQKIVGIIIVIGSVASVAIVGGFYVVGLFRKGKVDEEDRLIVILQKTVTELEGKVDRQKKDYDAEVHELNQKLDQFTKDLIALKKENETLINVLQGRDNQTVEFQKAVLAAVGTANQTHEYCKSTNESVARLCVLIEQHLKNIENKA